MGYRRGLTILTAGMIQELDTISRNKEIREKGVRSLKKEHGSMILLADTKVRISACVCAEEAFLLGKVRFSYRTGDIPRL